MFSTFLGELRGYLGKAFILATWVPVLIFASASVAIYLAGNRSLGQAWQSWLNLTIGGQGVLSVEFLVIVTFLAFIFYSVQIPLAQLFEGYWDHIPGLSIVGAKKREYYRRYLKKQEARIQQIADEVPADGRPTKEQMVRVNRLQYEIRSFPSLQEEQHIMATHLGNIYKAAELYPLRRYGADAVPIWPRLRSILPNDFAEHMVDAKMTTDFLLLFALLSVLFSLMALIYLLVQGAAVFLVLLCLLGLPVGVLAYRCAVVAAQDYADLIKVAFDLYRRSLLKALDLDIPSTLAEEQQLWRQLSAFLLHGREPKGSFHFTKPEA